MNQEYAEYPEHPLHDVPQQILDAGRSVMLDAAEWGEIDAEIVQPLADAVLAAALPDIRTWLETP